MTAASPTPHTRFTPPPPNTIGARHPRRLLAARRNPL